MVKYYESAMTIIQYMNETGLTFWKSLPVSLICVLAEWAVLICCVHSYSKELFVEKRSLLLHATLLVCCLLLQYQYLHVLLHCLILLIIAAVYICLITRCSWFNAVFESCIYCLLLELGKSICRDGLLAFGITWLFPGLSGLYLNLILLGLYLAYLLLLGVLFCRRKRKPLNLPISALQALGLLFPFILYLLVRFFQYGLVDRLDNAGWFSLDFLQYAVAVCALIVLRTMGNLLSAELDRNELLHRQMLMEQKQHQYEIQRESIEFINHRYHDLKHYLVGLETILHEAEQGTGADFQQAEDFVRSLKKEINPYSSMQQTGSSVMDVLLSQRIQECQSKGIRLLPYIDATRTNFISTLDLCALFGNAMDNAIEATETLDDPDQKEINIKIGTSDGLLLMRFYNRFRGERRQSTTGYLTTKENADSHGFGLSNIAAIAEKYGGTISSKCTENEFTLHVLIPLPETEEDTMP